jgi:NAD kinase
MIATARMIGDRVVPRARRQLRRGSVISPSFGSKNSTRRSNRSSLENYRLDRRVMLAVELRAATIRRNSRVLNDVVINKSASRASSRSTLISTAVRQLVSRRWSDRLNATGSTAYNLSAGGQ